MVTTVESTQKDHNNAFKGQIKDISAVLTFRPSRRSLTGADAQMRPLALSFPDYSREVVKGSMINKWN